MEDFINNWVDKGVLKNATLVFKKGFRGSKDDYRWVSIHPIISKIFEKLLSEQIVMYMDRFLS